MGEELGRRTAVLWLRSLSGLAFLASSHQDRTVSFSATIRPGEDTPCVYSRALLSPGWSGLELEGSKRETVEETAAVSLVLCVTCLFGGSPLSAFPILSGFPSGPFYSLEGGMCLGEFDFSTPSNRLVIWFLWA